MTPDAKTQAWIRELVTRAGGDIEKVVRYLQGIGVPASRRQLREVILASLEHREENPPSLYDALRDMEKRFREGDEKLKAMLERHKLEQIEERRKKRERQEKPERDRRARFLRSARKEERRRRRREDNPATIARESVAQAANAFEKFTGERAGKAEIMAIPEPGATMFVLGELAEITYVTSKQGGGRVEYVHRFHRPRPKLLADPTGKALFIAGGGFKVDDRGIVG